MARKPRPAKRARATDPAKHAIEIAMALAAEKGWRDLTLTDIASAAKMSLADLYALYPSKQAILTAFVRDVDRAVLAESEPSEGTAKDRLFDVLMRRLDKLDPYKAAVKRIGEDTVRDPLAFLCSLGRVDHSMAAMLEAAGISAGGLTGMVRAKGLSAVYLSALRAWVKDESADKSKTMAALDRALGRAERVAGGFRRREKRSAAA